MGASSPRLLARWLVRPLALILTGCTAAPGLMNPLAIFSPQGQRLLKPAQEMRAAAPQPLPGPRELDRQVLPPYQVEPGDVLLVQPADLDSPVRLPGDQPVLPDGTIQLGRYGRLVVAGRTVEEVESLVGAAVAAQTKDAGPIAVRVVTRVSKVVYVLGEVNAPGSYPVAGRETVLDALLVAGGLNDRASRDNIILSRPTRPDGCRVVLPVCYSEIVQLGDTTTNYQVFPGDRIFVPAQTFWEGLCPMKGCEPCGGPQVPCSAGCEPVGGPTPPR